MTESTQAKSSHPVSPADITVVGAGLVGSLLALLLARRGFNVEVFERRPDMRREKVEAGRSINLAISTRGITALERAGLGADILAQAIPMYGRMMHSKAGELTFQPYGKDRSEYINSISRAEFNKVLIERAEATGKVKFHFERKALGMDFEHSLLKLSGPDDALLELATNLVIGTDGSASKIRDDMSALKGHEAASSRLDYGYKELYIPPIAAAAAGSDASFSLEKNALHIWPRGSYLMIALPNLDGSFTGTVFLPYKGPVSFEKLVTVEQVQAFFEADFADAVPLIPNLAENFVKSPLGHLDTVKAQPWNVGGKALLLGDAAHAIIPFYGQGANCGLEDLTIFEQCVEDHLKRGGSLHGGENGAGDGWRVIFDKLTALRKVNCDAISDMAVENFVEMRDRVADPHFLLMKAVEKILEKKFPGRYRSRYSLVTFSNAPYKLALDVGVICEEILNELCKGLTDPEKVDLVRAEALINEKLAPILAGSLATL
ncbi:MAG: FAD-dependent monooxygenase [Cyanobacteria bacterium REEB67]|nr:FAD-dependent monooxygenase [Cyanobacteria bacterium REEB67]